MELIEKLMNSKHYVLSYREVKNRQWCDAPGTGKIRKQITSLFKPQDLKLEGKIMAYNPKFIVLYDNTDKTQKSHKLTLQDFLVLIITKWNLFLKKMLERKRC